MSAGGLITTLLEMTFTHNDIGLDIDLSGFPDDDTIKILFSENPGIIIQASNTGDVLNILNDAEIKHHVIGKPINERTLIICKNDFSKKFNIPIFNNRIIN